MFFFIFSTVLSVNLKKDQSEAIACLTASLVKIKDSLSSLLRANDAETFHILKCLLEQNGLLLQVCKMKYEFLGGIKHGQTQKCGLSPKGFSWGLFQKAG